MLTLAAVPLVSPSLHPFVSLSSLASPRFPDSAIPLERMWLDDKYWLPLLLEGKAFVGRFVFRGHEEVVSHELREVSAESLPYADDAQLVTELQSAITAT
jgi:hypothetical protein